MDITQHTAKHRTITEYHNGVTINNEAQTAEPLPKNGKQVA